MLRPGFSPRPGTWSPPVATLVLGIRGTNPAFGWTPDWNGTDFSRRDSPRPIGPRTYPPATRVRATNPRRSAPTPATAEVMAAPALRSGRRSVTAWLVVRLG